MTVTERVTGYDRFRARVPEGESGGWQIERFSVSRDASALAVWTQRIHVAPGDYTRLTFGRGTVVMSDTHDEYRDHSHAIHRATGRVLINGLGLGCVLGAILDKPDVTHVDVVERSEDVLALVGPTFADDLRVNLIQADAYEQAKAWPTGTRWDVAWHDIWTDICTDDLGGHARLLRSYGRRTDWQGAWRHEYLVSQRRRGW